MKIFAVIIGCFFFISVFSQKYNLEFTIQNIPNPKVYLLSFYGDDNKLVDSLSGIGSGKFTTTFTDKNKPGLYRLFIDRETTIDFIFNKENVVFNTDYNESVDSMKIVQSEENKLYYEFLKKDRQYQRKLELISPLVTNYPKDDKFYLDVKKQYTLIQNDRDAFVSALIAKNPQSYAAKIFKIKKTPFIDSELNEYDKMEYLKKHFWDNVDFNDTALFHSNVFTSKVLSFLMLYNNRNYPPHIQEEAFINAVDVILPKARVNKKAYEFIMNFMMSGFENFKFERVLEHISKNYKIETNCENEERKSTLQKRLDTYQLLNIGKNAPEISTPDVNGNIITFEQIKTEFTVLVFWATWCPHCTEMLPEINKIYKAQSTKRFEIIAFSLDTNKTQWTDFVKHHNFSFYNISDLKSWDSKLSDDYCIYATPTMFVLDNKRKILAKPITVPELLESLQRLKILDDK